MKIECLSCGGKRFETKDVQIDTELRGLSLSIQVNGLVCENCSQVLMDAQMMSRLQILTADEYRRLSDLLPSAIIRQYRESLKMTQNEFADFLGVGVASVKRWEGSGIQEKSHDELIRLKCDLRYARENLENLEDRLNVSCGATTRSVYQDFGGKSVLAIVDDYSPVNEIRLKA